MDGWIDEQVDVNLLRQSECCQESLLSRHSTAQRRETTVLFHPDLSCLTCWHGNCRKSKSTHCQEILLLSSKNLVTPKLEGLLLLQMKEHVERLLSTSVIMKHFHNHVDEVETASKQASFSMLLNSWVYGETFYAQTGAKWKEWLEKEIQQTSFFTISCVHSVITLGY